MALEEELQQPADGKEKNPGLVHGQEDSICSRKLKMDFYTTAHSEVAPRGGMGGTWWRNMNFFQNMSLY